MEPFVSNWCVVYQAHIKLSSEKSDQKDAILLMYYSREQFLRDLMIYIRENPEYDHFSDIRLERKQDLDDLLFQQMTMHFELCKDVGEEKKYIKIDSPVTKDILFIGINAGEDWSHIKFARPYLYLYFSPDESYALKTTAPHFDLKNIQIDTNLRTVLPAVSCRYLAVIPYGFSLETSRGKLSFRSSVEKCEICWTNYHGTLSLGISLPWAIPLLPEMIRERTLLFRHEDGSRFWLGTIRCIFQEYSGYIVRIYPLVLSSLSLDDDNNNVNSEKETNLGIFNCDKYGNIYVCNQYRFSKDVQ